MIRDLAGQMIGAELVSATDGSAFTGAVTVYIKGDDAAQVIGSVGGGACTADGHGHYSYHPAEAETDYSFIAFTFTGTGAVPACVQVYPNTVAEQAALGGPSGAFASTGLAVCRAAAIEIGHLDPLETLNAGDAAFILGAVNQLLDDWNGDRDAVYADVFTTYTLTPSLSPHTIGPTGTLVTAQRPVSIDGVNLVLTTENPDVAIPVAPRDAQWWKAQPIKALTSSVPTDFYYQTAWPNGAIYLWPVPTVAYGLEVRTRTVLTALAFATTFSLPPGYLSAITLTVAEAVAGPLGIAVLPTTTTRAAKARDRIFTNNRAPTPKLRTRDAGLPGGGGTRGTYLTGWR